MTAVSNDLPTKILTHKPEKHMLGFGFIFWSRLKSAHARYLTLTHKTDKDSRRKETRVTASWLNASEASCSLNDMPFQTWKCVFFFIIILLWLPINWKMATCLQTTANYSLTSSERVTPTGTFAFEVKAEPFAMCYLQCFYFEGKPSASLVCVTLFLPLSQ